VEGLEINRGDRLGSWIFANPPVFLASWGFSNNSGSAALYHAENKAQKEQLKRTPR